MTVEDSHGPGDPAAPGAAGPSPRANRIGRGRLSEQLRQSRQDLEEAQRIARVGSWTLDPSTGQATWSPQMYRILGRDPDGPPIELGDIGRLFTAVSVEAVGAAVQHTTATGEPWLLDLEVVRPDGRNLTVVSQGVGELGADGSVVLIRGTMQDVTEQRRAEVQLAQAQRLEAIGKLAGGIAHDFNNILTAIRGYSEFALEDIDTAPARARTDVEQVIAAADRAAELVRQLLAFSRRQVLAPRIVDVGAVVTGIGPMLQRLLGEHIDLQTHAAADVGRVRIDPTQLEQVLLNLVVNARDAMPEGGLVSIDVANVELDEGYVESHPEVSPGAFVALSVSDTGTGMDAATLARIFDPFFTTKAPGVGTGMGLATVYGVVNQSGGSIYVYSEAGHGSSFKVYLPRVRGDVDAADEDARPPDMGGSECILLVEDDGVVRRFAARALVARGYRVVEATNGREALDLAATLREPVDLLVTDVIMPGMQGRELAERFIAQSPGTRTLLVSGFTNDVLIENGLSSASDRFLPKPFTADALSRAVRATLDDA